MDRRARDFIEVTRFSVEHFVGQPAKENERANRCRQTEQKRETDKLKSAFHHPELLHDFELCPLSGSALARLIFDDDLEDVFAGREGRAEL